MRPSSLQDWITLHRTSLTTISVQSHAWSWTISQVYLLLILLIDLSVLPPSLLSSLIASLGRLADTGLCAPGFLWTRHFPKITWAKHFHSQAGWGPAEAAGLMEKRWISAGWRSTVRRANTFILYNIKIRGIDDDDDVTSTLKNVYLYRKRISCLLSVSY